MIRTIQLSFAKSANRRRLLAVLTLALATNALADTAGQSPAVARREFEVGFDATVGPLLELRLQLFPWKVRSTRSGLEVMFGFNVPYFGKQVGVGYRFEWKPFERANSALLLSPGVDLYLVLGEGSPQTNGGSLSTGGWFSGPFFRSPVDNVGLLSPGLDVGVRHAFSPNFAAVLGARVAATVSLGGRQSENKETAGRVNVVGGLFAGVRI